MEFKHTPAPWNVFEGQYVVNPGIDSEHRTIIVWGNEGEECGILGVGEEQQANANLIASAPELLEALIELQDFSTRKISGNNNNPIWLKVANVISKATGGVR